MATLFDLIANSINESENPKPKPTLDGGKAKEAVERKLLKRFWDSELPLDRGKRVGELIAAAAKRAGLAPEVFYASAYQEGLPNAKFIGTMEEGDAALYDDSTEEFPVNAFFHYGLDTIGDRIEVLKQKGYLPAEMEHRPFRAVNEKGESVNSAYFRNNQDALYAKAAYMRDFQDRVLESANKIGMKLDGDALNYFTMAAYNAGLDNAIGMMKEAKRGDVSQYVKSGGNYPRIHKNIEPRMRYAQMMREILKEEAERKAVMVNPPAQPVLPAEPRMAGGTLGLISNATRG